MDKQTNEEKTRKIQALNNKIAIIEALRTHPKAVASREISEGDYMNALADQLESEVQVEAKSIEDKK